MTAAALREEWAKVGGRDIWRALTEAGAVLTVSHSVADKTWAAVVDPPLGLWDITPQTSYGHRTRLIAQEWAQRAAAARHG